MPDPTPRLGLTTLEQGQALASVPVNSALNLLSITGNKLLCVNTQLSAEPPTPSDGEAWVINGTPTGSDWSNFADKDIAYYQDGWSNITLGLADEGFEVYDQASNLKYWWDGSAWQSGEAGTDFLPLAGGTMSGALNMGNSAVQAAASVGLQGVTSNNGLTVTYDDAGDEAMALVVNGPNDPALTVDLSFSGISAAREFTLPDASGTLALEERTERVLYSRDPGDGEVTITNQATGYTTVWSWTLPANTLVSVGDMIHAHIICDKTTGSEKWRCQHTLDGQVVGKDNNDMNSLYFSVHLYAYVTTAGATGTVKGHQTIEGGGTGQVATEQDAVSINLTSDLTLAFKASSDTLTTDGVTVRHAMVKLIPKVG